jgi:hypothetical protein
VFVPNDDVFGDVTFGYVGNDGFADGAEATATVSLTGAPDAPEVVNPNTPVAALSETPSGITLDSTAAT